MMVILMVVLISPFSVVLVKSEKLIDPIGANKVSQKGSDTTETEEYQVAATLASILDESLAEDAFKKANAVTEASSLSLPISTTYAISTPIITGESSNVGKETFRKYLVQNGDTLWGIARANDLTVDTLRWANDLSDIENVKPGSEILIPSTVGVLYTVKGGESIVGIASRYGVSPALIESYNNVIDEELKPGMRIMIPDGAGPAMPTPDPKPETQIAGGGRNQSSSGSAPQIVSSSSGPNRFPYGYCTWWVASKRYVPWNGNAWQWYGNSIAYGKSVGRTPVAGAVMVTWESPVGHVAYVESVNGDGSFNVSEMNFSGWGRVSRRTTSVGQVPFIGFIY